LDSILTTAAPWEPALRIVFHQIQQRLNPGAVFVGWADGELYRVIAAAGEAASSFDGAVLPLAMTHCKDVIETGQPVCIPEFTENSARLAFQLAYPCRSYLGVPLIVPGSRIPFTLAVAHAAPHPFSEQDTPFLLDMAALLSAHAHGVIRHQRLVTQESRLEALLGVGLVAEGGFAKVARKICQSCNDLFAIKASRVVSKKDGGLSVASCACRGESQCVVPAPGASDFPEQAIMASGQIRFIDHFQGATTPEVCWAGFTPTLFIGLPVFDSRGQVAAVLSLYDDRRRAYDDSELALLKVFAEKLSSEWNHEVSEQSLLQAEMQAQRRAHHLEILHNISEGARRGIQFNELALETMNRCIHWLSLSHGALYFGIDGAWILVAHHGFSDRFPILGSYIPASELPWTSQRQPAADFIPGEPLQSAFEEEHLRSWLLIPLTEGEAVQGGIVLASQAGHAFNEEIAAMAAGISEQMSVALLQARLSRELAEQAADLQAVISSLSDALVEITADRTILQSNRAAELLLGLRPGHQSADEWHAVIPLWDITTGEPAGDRHPVQKSFREVRTQPATQWRLERSERTAFVSVTAAPLIDRITGAARAVVVAVRDISEQRILDQKILSAEKYASVASLAAGVAHEFKNYLAGIVGNASLAQKIAGSDGATSPVLQRIMDISARANQTALALLSYVKDAEVERQVTDLGSLCVEVVCLIEQRADMKATQIVRDLEQGIRADIVPTKIRQVLVNILENALEAMPKGGTINFILVDEEGQAVIKIADNGVGIALEHLPRVFDPFFSTKGVWGGQVGAGTGLGLTTSLNYVREHGGDLRLKSTQGQGTEVTVTLPLAPAQSMPALPKGGPVARTALLMECDEALRDLLANEIKRIGWQVVVSECAAFVDKAIAQSAIGAAFLDTLMPGKINFIRAFEKLRDEQPGCLIFVTSSDVTDYQLADYIRAAAGRIIKPASREKVSAFLDVHLKHSSAHA
jgi:signal transduction histidine kinase